MDTFTHPAKWRETADPFTLDYNCFRPEEILGYPHAGNDVFHIKGKIHGAPVTAYLKIARRKDAAIDNEVALLSQLNDPLFPKLLDHDGSKGTFSLTAELPGLRLSVILGENEDLASLSYMEEYGEALSRIHSLTPSARPQADRKFYHRPSEELLEELELSSLSDFFAQEPVGGERVFCHGDLHYANVLWKDHHISAILDFELAGYGDRDFDIAWAIFLRPGPRFLRTAQEQEAFLKGYQKHRACNPEAVRYYMARCYVYFLHFCKEEEDYCRYIRKPLAENCGDTGAAHRACPPL